MKKIIYTFLTVFAIVGIAEAVNPFDIEYPIAELGSCNSQQECKVFCDEPTNIDSCIAFAENKGMIKKEDVKRMREETKRFEKDLEEFEDSPGQCKTPRECDTYCRDEEHLDECLDFGVKYGHTTAEEAQRIREQTARGGPGGCKSDTECRNYCDNPENEDECFNFVVKEGKITVEEAEFMKKRMKSHRGDFGSERGSRGSEENMDNIDEEKVLELLQEMDGPGGCKTMEECGQYCSDFSHGEECMEFAIKNQIAPPEALERMKKMNSIGSGPGGCTGPDECDAFCSQPENRQECFEFTKINQLASPEELIMMEREMQIADKLDSGEEGPGGCVGQEECSNYCFDPNNLEECMNFSAQHGLISGDVAEEMMGRSRGAMRKMREIDRQKEFFFGGPSPTEFGEGEFGERRFSEDPRQGSDFREQRPPEGFRPPMSPEEFERMKEEGILLPDGMIPPFGDDSRFDRKGDVEDGRRGDFRDDRRGGDRGDREDEENRGEFGREMPPLHGNKFIPPTEDDMRDFDKMDFENEFEPRYDEDFVPPSDDNSRPPREFDEDFKTFRREMIDSKADFQQENDNFKFSSEFDDNEENSRPFMEDMMRDKMRDFRDDSTNEYKSNENFRDDFREDNNYQGFSSPEDFDGNFMRDDGMNFDDGFKQGGGFNPTSNNENYNSPEVFEDNFRREDFTQMQPPAGFEPPMNMDFQSFENNNSQLPQDFNPPMDNNFVPPVNTDFVNQGVVPEPIPEFINNEPVGFLSPFRLLGSMINAFVR